MKAYMTHTFLKKIYIIYPDDSNLQFISCTTLQCDSSKMYNNRTQKQNMVWLTDFFIFNVSCIRESVQSKQAYKAQIGRNQS